MASINDILKPSALGLPESPRVDSILSSGYTDSVGDPALWIVVVLYNETRDEERDWKHLRPIHDRIAAALESNGIDLYPYVRFVTESELLSEEAA